MSSTTGRERSLITSGDRETLVRCALGGSYKSLALEKGISEQSVKNRICDIYDKVEGATGVRPFRANVILFAIFGRFLTGDEVSYLIEEGELHDWHILEEE